MSLWFLLVLWSFVTYRLVRLFILDEWIEELREIYLERIISPLTEHERSQVLDKESTAPLRKLKLWRRKLYTLVTCPYCVSAYFAAGVLLLHRWVVDDFAMPVWMWLATWTGSLLIYRYMDAES